MIANKLQLRLGRAVLLALALLLSSDARAQTTSFTYQGKLIDNGNPANGNYDFQFKLFDTATVGTGTQLGSTAFVPTVQVTAGIFTVQLDFGVSVFPGAARFLEIAVKKTIDSTFTTLSPRQPVTSNPYAIRSLAATAADGLSVTCVGCITSSQIQTVQGSQVTGLLPVASIPPGSSSYVQNGTSQQASNFNISGDGTAGGALSGNVLNATTQFNLGGNRILGNAGTNNVFAGIGAGAVNTGSENAFFGRNAGFSNTTGGDNAFFGNTAGGRNTTGGGNSFFGSSAGSFNVTGSSNSFFGAGAGSFNTGGVDNSFFGVNAGSGNTTGSFNAFFGKGAGNKNVTAAGNSFFGTSAGFNNTTGQLNAFFGESAGNANTTGTGNTFIGRDADFDVTSPTGDNNTLLGANTRVISGVSNSTAIGAGVVVSTTNTIVLGTSAHTVQVPGALSIGGTFGANILNATTQFNLGGNRILGNAGTSNLFAGIGAGESNTTGNGNSLFGASSGNANTTGIRNSFFGALTGLSNAAGGSNSFFGIEAGKLNTTGGFNSFFGDGAGVNNTTGSNNTFIGANAGNPNTATQVNNSIAIGSGVTVSTSNTIVLGTTAHTTKIPGKVVMGGGGGAIGGGDAEVFNTGVLEGVFTGSIVLYQLNTLLASPVHLCTIATQVGNGFGGDALTRCTSASSSVNNKTDVQPFSGGLDVINRLKPVTFKWKGGGTSDFGLNAEDVAEVEPLLVTRNVKGEVEDVKESSFNVLFINAFKEQQAQIDQQRQQINQQQAQIKGQQQEIDTLKNQQQKYDVLKRLICADHPDAPVCKSN